MNKHKDVNMCTIVCTKCGVEQGIENFSVQVTAANFRGSGQSTSRRVCKSCAASAARIRRATGYAPSGKVTKYPAEERMLVSACRFRCADARQRATRSGLPFDIDGDYLYSLYKEQAGLCAISRIPMTIDKRSVHVLSLDQVVAGAGYIKGNVQWLSWSVNRAKGDLSMPEFISMCMAIGRCNDYPEMEYAQVSGSALPA